MHSVNQTNLWERGDTCLGQMTGLLVKQKQLDKLDITIDS